MMILTDALYHLLVRTCFSMASTTPLPTLLKSLDIGASGRLDEESNAASTSQLAPRLSLTDQLHLLSAHIDTLEKSIQATVSSAEGRDTIRSQSASAIRLQQRVKDVHSRVQDLEDQTEKDNDQEKAYVVENLAQYITARKAHSRGRRIQEIADLLKDALSAVEDLESHLKEGRLEAENLANAVERVDRSASLLGIGAWKASNGDNGDSRSSYTWLAESAKASPIAIRNLSSRIERAKAEVKQDLLQRWNSCIHIESNEVNLSIKIKNDTGEKLSLHSTHIIYSLALFQLLFLSHS